MADGFIVIFGRDLLANPSIGTQSGAGTAGQGTATIQSGQRAFEDDDVIVLQVTNVDANGELTNASGLADVTVYEDFADFDADPPVVKFDYRPQNPGQTANLQSDLSGHGDGYARFVSANILIPENGGPSFNQLLVAPGTDVATIVGDDGGSLTKNRQEDFDFNLDGDTTDPNEPGNSRFLAGDYVTPTICFTAGTRLLTPEGERRIEDLSIGDLVWTLDSGPQAVRWIGHRRLPAAGPFAPVRFAPGTVGNVRALEVSQNHRMLRAGAAIELLFGTSEVLVPAKFLVNGADITLREEGWVTYVHVLFDTHELVWANGAPAETLRPGPGMSGPQTASARELLAIFPDLAGPDIAPADTARRSLRRFEADLLDG